MRVHNSVIVIACLHVCSAVQSGTYAGDLKPYPLPPAAGARIEKLAASIDVLILGEIHGTQEVPELVASLLTPLTVLGYHTLALEVPNKDQASLLAWARGETEKIPDFFANPTGDGRGNAQLMALTRIAVSPPFQWQIICFDDSRSILEQLISVQKKRSGREDILQSKFDYVSAFWQERDAAMASILLREAKSLKATTKILAVCGNLHARTKSDMQDPMLSKLWPSFAGLLKGGQPEWRVGSIDIDFYSGAFFNDGKVRTFPKRPLDDIDVRSTDRIGFDLVLSLPVARPATLATK